MESIKFILILATIQLFTYNASGYVITTPRKWSSEESNRVCVTLNSLVTPEDTLKVGVRVKGKEDDFILPLKPFPLVQGEMSICANLALKGGRHTSGDLVVVGKLGGVDLNFKKPISIANVFKTFVQTDKALYKPLQTVQFRILSIQGPYLKVSTEQYDEIVIENPSGTRIAQWLNVSNSNGLIHQSFELAEEPEEGTYTIKVRPANRDIETRTFKVEEYILPKYEVKLNTPSHIYGNAESFEVEVCAKYTFGQPVKGKVILTIDSQAWGPHREEKQFESPISGCKTTSVNSSYVGLNSDRRYVSAFRVHAVVIESGTNVELKSEDKILSIDRTVISFEVIGEQKYIKPELPFIAEFKATFIRDKLAINEPMKVCSRATCKNFTTNAKGILKVVVPPHLDRRISVKSINYSRIKAHNIWRTNMYESITSISLEKYHSSSNSSLSIVLEDDSIDCSATSHDIKFDLPVRFASKGQVQAFVSVQVISRGQIQFSKTFGQAFEKGSSLHFDESLLLAPLKPSSENSVRGSFVVSIVLPKFTSPKAKVIVWYTRDDGEVVADMRNLNIAKCLENYVNLTWSSGISQPGDPTVLSLRAEPLSLCSLGVVDKSVELLASASSPLTLEAVLDVAEKASVGERDNSQIDNSEYCMNKDTKPDGRPDIFPMPGLVPIPLRVRDRRSIIRPHDYYSNGKDALTMFNDAGLYVLSNQTLESRLCNQHRLVYYDEMDFMSLAGSMDVPVTLAEPSNTEKPSRVYFPETWLWQLIPVWENGEAEEQLYLPDTVTEWVGSAVCVHPTKGVGVSNKASITTFQDFFVDLTLPASIKMGETLPVKISVFNYLKESLPIRVVLEPSSEYEILPDSKTSEVAGEISSCVAAEDKVVHTIRIKPTTVGDVNITVAAQVDINSIESCGQSTGKVRKDVIVKPIRVEFEGFVKESVHSKYVCIKDVQNEVDIMDKWTLAPPSEIVPDSARGFVAVVGDMMGPTIENLGHLIKMPYGCGEQNMLNFAPNIFVMQYLESSNQKENAPVEKALNYMQKGYQRELNYRHEDGSFSAFGKRDDSGSTWLTAFVLKCFAQAKNYISVDENDLNVSRNWLQNLQQENGCFNSVGRVLHKGMKGGLSSKSEDSPVLLSSFVLISLIEAGQSTSDTVVREALFCLKAAIDTDHPYSLAVLSYALTLADSPDAVNVTQKLLNLGKGTTTSLYWELPKKSSSSKSVGVETAAYAVLALLELNKRYPEGNYVDNVPRILKWINSQRNGQGGFVSTQDTIVALQALAEFEKSVPQVPLDLTVFVKANEEESHFLVDENNKLLQQKSAVSKFPADVSFDLVGDGCVLLQALVRYNIPYPEPSETFNVTVETKTVADDSCKTKNVKVCVSYLLEDEVSNMGIMEVKLVSGYIPKKEDLKALVQSKEFKRYEIDGSLLTLYVDEFGRQPTCASFDILREVDVENAKPGSVKVYDYYKPEYFVTEKYELPVAGECVPEDEIEKPVTIPARRGSIPFFID